MAEQQQWIALAILFGLSTMVAIALSIAITTNASSDGDKAFDQQQQAYPRNLSYLDHHTKSVITDL